MNCTNAKLDEKIYIINFMLNFKFRMIVSFNYFMFNYLIYCLLNDKKYAQKVWSKYLVYKKPFGCG